jgi:hypothetical protein
MKSGMDGINLITTLITEVRIMRVAEHTVPKEDSDYHYTGLTRKDCERKYKVRKC